MDLGFIKKEYNHHGKKLRYFGLPGESLYDIEAWAEFIGEIYAAEIGSKSDPSSKQSLLIANAINMNVYDKLVLLRGEINEIILKGYDEIGTKIIYPFELINLDYGGSLLYKDRIRVKSLDVLFKNQQKKDFLLLITSNVREFDLEELIKTQDRIKKEFSQFGKKFINQLNLYFNQINKDESLLRQIIHVHYLIKNLAENNKFDIACYPGIKYEGSKQTILIHYIFRLRYNMQASTKTPSKQTLVEILNQGVQEVSNGKLVDMIKYPDIIVNNEL